MLIRFFRSEPAAAVVLFVAAILALIVANSPLGEPYDDVLHTYVFGLSIQHWINDGLMALFFLLVGLEIKQEFLTGELSTWSARVLPTVGAIGGLVVPALIFIAINAGSPAHLDGWAIPAATDIAFAVGVLSLLGSRVPLALRALLVGIAIIDDLGAILVIAIFYTSDLALPWLGGALGISALLFLLNGRHVHRIPPYIVLGIGLWICVFQSGLHATLAGVILAFAIPARATSDLHRSPLHTTEHAIDRWVNFGILPLFGFANAGVSFSGVGVGDLFGPLPLGVAAGLVIGKQIGIFGAIWLTIRLGLGRLPAALSWIQIYAMAVLGGIGFTMSLFIGSLAFGDSGDLIDETKIGVIAGSLIAGVVGALLMRRVLPRVAPVRIP